MKNKGKRLLATVLATTMTLTSLPAVTAVAAGDPAAYLLGDVDFDNTVSASDLTVLARLVGQIADLPVEGYQSDGTTRYLLGDLNLDGTLGAADLTALARHVGRIELLPQDSVFGYVEETGYDNTTYRIQTDTSSTEEVYNTYLEFATNPIIDDFADPELHRFTDEAGNPVYWIYATGGSNIRAAYSTDNMKTWNRVDDVVDMSTLTWVNASNPKIWAPSCLYYNGKYYLTFSNGDSHSSDPNAGINITVSDSPAGPFVAYTDGPLVWEHDENFSSMALIDQDLFLDEDGQVYMYYGGGGTCFMVKINAAMTGLAAFDDGSTYKQVTGLGGYMEAPYMIKRGDTYYLMYSGGIWSNDSYNVCYATSDSPEGPFTYGRRILATDDTGNHKGPGHHSAIYLPENNQWLICYHRWDQDDPYRSTCIDRMVFNEDGSIRSVVQTDGWTTNDDFGPDESNLALFATPTDSGYGHYGESATSFVNDGDGISYWQYSNKDAINAGACWIQLDFGEAVEHTRSVIKFESGTKPTETGYQLLYSEDGETWTAVPDVTAVYGDTVTLTYPVVSARYLRLNITENTNDKYATKMYEWEVYNDTVKSTAGVIQDDTDSTVTINTELTVTNPAIQEGMADPDLHRYTVDGKDVYYIYGTSNDCPNIRAIYSDDNMATWQYVETENNDGYVLDMSTFPWAEFSVWAPGALELDGKYYIVFSANNVPDSSRTGGIGIGVSDSPAGPFKAVEGTDDGLLVGSWIYGVTDEDDDAAFAEKMSGKPTLIDAHLFEDEDGQVYLYYGGGGHCAVALMNEDMNGLVPFEDGSLYKDITDGLGEYVEGPFMIKRGGTYYLMYSKGMWSSGSYATCYATSDSPIGGFTNSRQIIRSTSDESIYKGAGHNSALYLPENNMWLICYHRYNYNSSDRRPCIERMHFNDDGTIRSIVMTDGWTTDDYFGLDETDLALSATAIDCGRGMYGGSAACVNDGDNVTYWQVETGANSNHVLSNCWVGLDFGSATTFDQVVIEWESGTMCSEDGFALQFSDDGETWTNVSDVTMDYAYITTLDFPAVTARYMRIDMTYCINEKYSPKIYDLHVYGESVPAALSLVNPIVDHDELGTFYGDPEIHYFDGKYYIYSTTSRADRKQTNMDVFVSDDLVTWTQVKDILNMADFPQTTGCIWAPSVIKRGDYYYISFSINDIQSDSTTAGLMMARSESPTGPFVKYFDGPLIGRFIYGAQPIDGSFFEDDDGTVYFYYGGHANCNVAVLNETMDGFIPFEPIEEGDDQATIDSKTFISMTQSGNMGDYVEGSFVIKRDGVYYLMWSVGSYVDSTYGVEYATGDSPTGPFTFQRKILETDLRIASGPGHHSCLYLPEYDKWIICYHRREPDATTGTDRRLCIDELVFDEDGQILPVVMTDRWVLGGENDVYVDVNLAVMDGVTYSASSSATNFGPELAFDDCAADKHRWAQGSGSAGQWLAVDFGKETTYDSFAVTFEAAGANQFILQASDDGSTWRDVTGTLSLTDLDKSVKGRYAFFYFSETSSRYVRLYFPSGSTWLSVYEWEIYNAGKGDRTAIDAALAGAIADTSIYTASTAAVYDAALAYTKNAAARTEVAQKELIQAVKYLRKAALVLVERPAEGENMAPLATASASFTKNSGMLEKLNDGIDTAANRWTEHNNTAETCAWIQYDFDEAVTLNEMQIMWYQDSAELWAPAALDIQYWNGTEYVSVTATNEWAFTGNVYDTYTFSDVTSTSFRLQPTRQTGTKKFVGINEWKVFGSEN